MKQILKSNKGQTIIEYIIISSLIGILCMFAVKQLGSVVQRRINMIKENIVKTIPNQ